MEGNLKTQLSYLFGDLSDEEINGDYWADEVMKLLKNRIDKVISKRREIDINLRDIAIVEIVTREILE